MERTPSFSAPSSGLCGLAPSGGCDENKQPNFLEWWNDAQFRESGTHFSSVLPGARTCPSVWDASEEAAPPIDGH